MEQQTGTLSTLQDAVTFISCKVLLSFYNRAVASDLNSTAAFVIASTFRSSTLV